jgi:hypothetical protein
MLVMSVMSVSDDLLHYVTSPYKTFIFFDILPLRRNKKMAPLTTVRGVRLNKNRLGLQLDVVDARIPNPSDASVGSSFQQRGRLGRFGFV